MPQSDAGGGSGTAAAGGGGTGGGRAGSNASLVAPPHAERLRKSKVDGGSGLVVPVAPASTAGIPYAVPRVPGAGAVVQAGGGANSMGDDDGDSKMPAKPAAAGGGGGSGGSGPPASGTSGMGGVLIFGQTQITYANTAEGPAKTLPVAQALVLAVDPILLDDDAASAASAAAGGGDDAVVAAGRYLLATEDGSVHLLTVLRSARSGRVSSLHLETLGPAPALASAVSYLSDGLVFVGSNMGDSALMRILDRPVPVGGGSSAAPVDASMVQPTTYLSTVEEYTNLGPIVDFDVIPKDASSSASSSSPPSSSSDGKSSAALVGKNHRQCMVVTASGVGTAGTVRLVRSGIGLAESASIYLPGIKGMWNLRAKFGADAEDAYLVQSYVGETRVLGVVSTDGDEEGDDEEEASMEIDGASQDASQDAGSQESDDEEEEEGGATLAEVLIPGFDSNQSTLFAGNICPIPQDEAAPLGSDTLAVQVTDSEVRLVNLTSVTMDEEGDGPSGDAMSSLLDVYRPESEITVAAGNDAGQIILALRGGLVLYLTVLFNDGSFKIDCVAKKTLEREISCLDVRAFDQSPHSGGISGDIDKEVVEMDGGTKSSQIAIKRSNLVAVGLWDDFTVRLLSLDDLEEVLHINLGTDQETNTSSASMDVEGSSGADDDGGNGASNGNSKGQHMMARSLCMVTLGSGGGQHQSAGSESGSSARSQSSGVNVLLVGLGDGGLVSFAVSSTTDGSKKSYNVYARKEVSLGTRAVGLVPFRASTLLQEKDDDKSEKGSSSGGAGGGTCVLATGDRPTVVYLAGTNSSSARGGGGTIVPKLCYSSVHLSSNPSSADDEGEGQQMGGPNGGAGRESLTVTVAAPFHSSLLVSSAASGGTADGSDQQDFSLTYPLCVADESTLRLGIIDDIQKLHVTTHKLGMTPRRVAYHEAGRVICVGAIDGNSSSTNGGDGGIMQGESNMGNCVRFFDDTTLEEVDRLDLDPFEMILSMVSATLTVGSGETAGESDGSKRRVSRPYIIIGTAYAYPDEDEPTKGRVLLIQCGGGGGTDGNAAGDDTPMADAGAAGEGSTMPSALNRTVRIASELIMKGGVYSICPFYDGSLLVTENSKTRYCRIIDGSLKVVGAGHHGHILSLCAQSLVSPHAASGPATSDDERSQIAIVGDLMRSVSVVQYFPKYKALEEVARDYNALWTTAAEMLTENIYLVAENWCNFVVLKRNPKAAAEEVRCRLETVGEFNAGEMTNKLMSGSLVVPTASNDGFYDSRGGALGSGDSSPGGFTGIRSPKKAKKAAAANSNAPMKAVVTIGSRTLYCTVDGSIGSCLGLDGPTAAFFCALERCMARSIRPVGGLGHSEFRAFVAEKRHHPSRGFVDGDFIESFLDLDRTTMERVVAEMNEDGRWETEDLGAGSIPSGEGSGGRSKDQKTILMVEDVIGMVEEISMSH